MKIGLIARCEVARGIAIQSKNFYDNMPVHRVLVVRMPQPDCREEPQWYGASLHVDYDPRSHTLNEEDVRSWLDGLDVVFTVETPNDWRIPQWCREQGVKLIIQGNPEFVRHGNPGFEHLPHPDAWWWPTRWLLDSLPPGPVMPVPMNPRSVTPPDDDRLHLLHVIGKRAFADRNGTDVLVAAMPGITRPIKLTVHGIDGDLPEFRRRPNIEYVFQPRMVKDRFQMYSGQHAIVLPRRYGGLCLPAVEAASCGLAVMMPDCSPNDELAAVRHGGLFRRPINLAHGKVQMVDTNPQALAHAIDSLSFAMSRGEFPNILRDQRRLLNTWDEWRPKYLAAMEEML